MDLTLRWSLRGNILNQRPIWMRGEVQVELLVEVFGDEHLKRSCASPEYAFKRFVEGFELFRDFCAWEFVVFLDAFVDRLPHDLA